MRFLCKVSSILKISHVPNDDRFAALTNRPGVEGDVGSREVA